jgi:hypothetical protein
MFRRLGSTAPALAATIMALGCLASSAGAQEAIPTAQNAQFGGAPPAPPPGPVEMPKHYRDGARDIVREVGPCGGRVDPATGKLDQSPHGEVHASVGTAGYREAGGEVCLPVGDHVAATVAIDVGQYPYYGWRR